MRIGIISDIHGCLVGLKATLDWLDEAGVEHIVCAGDVANFGPQPNECIALLAERGIAAVQGNGDFLILKPPPAGPFASVRIDQITAIENWGRERLTTASRAWLAALPVQLAPAPGVLVVHGSLEKQDGIVDERARIALPPGTMVVAAGHLHVPFINPAPPGIWVNAGSAGRSCDGDPRAALAVLEQVGEDWRAEIHRVAFNVEEAVEAIRRADMPFTERLIETQRLACWW